MQDRLDTPQSEGEAFRRVWQRVQGQPGPGDYLIPEGPGERPLPPAPPKPQPPQPPLGRPGPRRDRTWRDCCAGSWRS